MRGRDENETGGFLYKKIVDVDEVSVTIQS